MLRFRIYPSWVICDIKKQFFQIRVTQSKEQCFVYRSEVDQNLGVYCLQSLIMGHPSSSNLSGEFIIKACEMYDGSFPPKIRQSGDNLNSLNLYPPLKLAMMEGGILYYKTALDDKLLQETGKSALYADDLFIGESIPKLVLERAIKFIVVLASRGFRNHKLLSSNAKLLDTIIKTCIDFWVLSALHPTIALSRSEEEEEEIKSNVLGDEPNDADLIELEDTSSLDMDPINPPQVLSVQGINMRRYGEDDTMLCMSRSTQPGTKS